MKNTDHLDIFILIGKESVNSSLHKLINSKYHCQPIFISSLQAILKTVNRLKKLKPTHVIKTKKVAKHQTKNTTKLFLHTLRNRP